MRIREIIESEAIEIDHDVYAWHISVDGLASISFSDLLKELEKEDFKRLGLDLSTSDIVYKKYDDTPTLKTTIDRHLDTFVGKAIIASISGNNEVWYINYPRKIEFWISLT